MENEPLLLQLMSPELCLDWIRLAKFAYFAANTSNGLRIHCNQKRGWIMKITVETTVAAPLEEVWRVYTSPEDIKQWNAASDDWHTTAAAVDLRVGGAFSSRMEAKDGSMGFDFAGTYTNIVKYKLIEYAFGDRTAQVKFDDTSKGVNVSVSFDSDPTHSIDQQRNGWQAILNNFARHVEKSR
jgi:uncharacterized protein YndB with AHSA1/START domain